MKRKIMVTRSSMPPFEEYVEMIKPLWDSHWLTNMGQYHIELEERLSEYLGIENVALTVNGHMALELALQSLKLPAGGEVITTPFTFISTTHAILRNGLKPVFCDIKDDFTIDEERIEELITDATVAIVPVHVYGNICNVEKIAEIAAKYDLRVVYDAAHAFGEEYKGQGVASFGDLSAFSFHATKVYNTIEGGAVCSHRKEDYEKIYNLKNFGIRSEELIVSVGANAKMNEFAAAMGLCNLKHIDEEIAKRKAVAELYYSLLRENGHIRLNYYREGIKPNYAYFPVIFESREMRDEIYDRLREDDIYSRKYFYPLTADAACFKNKYKAVRLDKARYYSDRVLTLPVYAGLEEQDVVRVVRDIEETL